MAKKAAAPTKIRGQIVNRGELAEIFGVSLPTIDRWIRAGAPVTKQGSRGMAAEYNTAEVIDWQLRTQLEEATGALVADDATLDRRMKTAKAVRVELQVEKERGTLAPTEQIEMVVGACFAELRAGLRIIPSRAYGALVGEEDETRWKAVLMAEIDNALTALSGAKLFDVPDMGDADDEEE